MMARIGAVIFIIGAMMADSESLIVPMAMVTAGALLMWKGGIFGGKKNS